MIIFSYNFHHQKTQDFLFYCRHYGYEVSLVVAANFRDLGYPKKRIRSSLRTIGLIHPEEICKELGIDYLVMDHNSSDLPEILASRNPEIGLVSGARILSSAVIESFSKGIVNFHPGLIPEARGLDTPQWCVYDDIPLGITSHFIDSKVDAGLIIEKKSLPEYPDDTLVDVSVRLYQGQLEMFQSTMDKAINDNLESFSPVPKKRKAPYSVFPIELEDELEKKIATRFPKSS
tara:strand:- start:260 stop:955 length:696 start_codon:yes stop_codon:yes gene_type:complete